MADQWDEGQAYVHSLRAQGYSESDIRTAMRQAGWEDMQIQALLAAQPLPILQPPAAVPPAGMEPAMNILPPEGARTASARRGSGSRGLVVAAAIVGVILLTVLIGSIVLTALYLRNLSSLSGTSPSSEAEVSVPETPPTTLGAVPEGAGAETALATAKAIAGEGPGDCVVVSHRGDWRQVIVWCRPAEEESPNYLYEAGLEWNEAKATYGRAYLLFLRDPPEPKGEPELTDAWEVGPCQAEALRKVFEVLAGDYVARVTSRSSDWRRAEIWIGPMASEYGEAVTVEWQEGEYQVTATTHLLGDEAPPEHTEIVD